MCLLGLTIILSTQWCCNFFFLRCKFFTYKKKKNYCVILGYFWIIVIFKGPPHVRSQHMRVQTLGLGINYEKTKHLCHFCNFVALSGKYLVIPDIGPTLFSSTYLPLTTIWILCVFWHLLVNKHRKTLTHILRVRLPKHSEYVDRFLVFSGELAQCF